MVMRHETHTLIATVRQHVETWRKANGWSRETAAMQIVEVHERIGAAAATGIVFDPPSRDTFERAKVNADRIFRWLDDVSKDVNLLPANFLPSVLAALPMDRRMALTNELLRPLLLATRAMPERDEGDSTVMLFKGLVNLSAEASAAMADLIDGVAPGELERAQTALGEAQRKNAEALAKVEAKLTEGEGGS